MPAFDIMPWVSPLGGTVEVRYAPMTASQTYLLGQPVGIVDAGTLTQAPNDGTQWVLGDMDTVGNICGIAAFGVGGDDGDGTTSTVNAPTNPKTNAVFATNDEVAYWPADQGNLFITNNMHDTATSAAVVPVQTDVGEIYMISSSLTAGVHGFGFGIEQTAGVVATDVLAIVHDVLDSNRAPIRLSGNAGVHIVFEIKTK